MGEVTTLREAVGELVNDGDSVALEGFTHPIPTAARHEIIRQERQRLTLIRMTPDLIYDWRSSTPSKLIGGATSRFGGYGHPEGRGHRRG